MENASKALIIAGAILLAILIIGLGMLVFTQVRSQVQDTNLSSEAAETFNSKFAAYEGSKISGTKVKALLDQIRSYNNTKNADVGEVDISLDDTGNVKGDLTTAKNGISSSATYEVKLTGFVANGDRKGFVNKIYINKNS